MRQIAPYRRRALEKLCIGSATGGTGAGCQARHGKELVGSAWSGYPWPGDPSRGEAFGVGAVGSALQHAVFRYYAPALYEGATVQQALLRTIFDRAIGAGGPWTADIHGQAGAQPPADISGSNLPSAWTKTTAKTSINITAETAQVIDITSVINELCGLSGFDGHINLVFFSTMTPTADDTIRVQTSPVLVLRGISA